MIDLQKLREKLKDVYDPGIGINIVDLGLIYRMDEIEEGTLQIGMTMTTQGCPAHNGISESVEEAATQESLV